MCLGCIGPGWGGDRVAGWRDVGEGQMGGEGRKTEVLAPEAGTVVGVADPSL